MNTLASTSTSASDSILLYNATILSFCSNSQQNKQAMYQAIYIEDGKIVEIGTNENILKKFSHSSLPKIKKNQNKIQIIDLKNKFVLPGFIESHAHILGIGRMKLRLNVNNLSCEDEMVQKVLDYYYYNCNCNSNSFNKNNSHWILGRGWDQNRWDKKELPTNQKLSKAIPDTPVLLTRVDGHAALANKCALNLAGIGKYTKDPDGGKIIRNSNSDSNPKQEGEPTGILIDNAIDLVRKIIPQETIEEKRQFLKLAIEECLKMGVTSLVEAQTDQELLTLIKEFEKNGELKIKVHPLYDGFDQNHRSIKLFLDGALGSYGAYLQTPYNDRPSEIGLKTIEENKLFEIFCQAINNNIQIAAHALGDGAVTYFIDIYEKALAKTKVKEKDINDTKDIKDIESISRNLRFRIEHAELIDPRDIKRIKNLGLILSMQPTHCTSDMHWINERIGEIRSKERFCIWKTLLNENITLAFGTDAPIESLNPFDTIYAAITRQDKLLQWRADGGFNEKEKLSIGETIKAMTMDAAYSIFQEDNIGSLSIGKAADLIVIDKNIFDENIIKNNPSEILNSKVLMTMVNGKVHYQNI
ncbi:MAG: amidohydrolase [Oligoflexia bacterium]|nr:amidohydrolase [Oligoflexia bacterium]